jgi:hypothetical protein
MKAHGTSELLTQIDTIMANLPYRYRFSPTRWTKGLDVMIEKNREHDVWILFALFYSMKPILTRTISVSGGKCYFKRKPTMQWQSSSMAVGKTCLLLISL